METKQAKEPSDVKAKRLNIGGYERHIFLCTGPDCCSAEEGLALWEYLKEKLKERGLASVADAKVYRTKANCLRICCDGPIAVVYPEGTWYRHLTRHAIDRIIDEHLVKGVPVTEFAFAKNPL